METVSEPVEPEKVNPEHSLSDQKLLLEIKDLKRKWIKEVLQIALPTSVAILSLAYAISSGLFSTKYDLLQLQKENLSYDIRVFEAKKEELIKGNILLVHLNDSLKGTLQRERDFAKNFKSRLASMQNEILEKERQLNELKSAKAYYEKENKTLDADYAKKKRNYENELRKQFISESDLKDKLDVANRKINFLKHDTAYLTFAFRVVDDNPFIAKLRKRDFIEWNLEQRQKYLDKSIAESTKKMELYEAEAKKHLRKADSIQAEKKIRQLEYKKD